MLLVGIGACGAPTSDGPTTAIEVSITDDAIVLDQTSAPAGKIAFGITNDGTDVHEFEVFTGRVADLHVVANVADTSSVTQIDEVEDLVPGSFTTFEVVLQPGEYVIISNHPGEFEAGMVAELTITD
jgi:uncharacterized cupredoxin-like copper-binding protein